MKSIYIHIPFCDKICSYCDFVKRVSSDEIKQKYVDKLLEEIESKISYFRLVETIFIGGGTPTSINLNDLNRILDKINKNTKDNIEFTIESNIENISEPLIDVLVKNNVNRVSIGIQTFNNKLQDIINRHHTFDDVKIAVERLRRKGINNINIDMMFSIPTQTIEMLMDDIKKLSVLNVEHISYYSLILEEKTILHHWYKKNKIELLDNSDEASMYEITMKELKKQGYKHYEISNYCKNNESEHNKAYWLNKEYLGLGLGAHGYVDGIRYSNTSDMSKYINSEITDEQIVLSTKDKISEELFLGLRMYRGVDLEKFKINYKQTVYKCFPFINDLIKEGLLIESSGRLRLSKKGLMFGNDIFEKFI